MQRLSIKAFFGSRYGCAACIGAVVVLASTLATLIWMIKSTNMDLAIFRSSFDHTRTLERVWDAELLSLQLGVSRNSDAVTQAAHDLNLCLKELEQITQSDGDLADLEPGLKSYQETINRKDRLSDELKTSYAMLRNSAAVMPRAIADVYKEPGVLAFMGGPENKRVADLVTDTATAMVSYKDTPTDILHDAVQQRIDATRAAARALPPALAGAIDRFLVKTEAVIKERRRRSELMLDLRAVPSAAVAADLDTQLVALEAAQSSSERRLQEMAVGNAAILALALATLLIVLRHRLSKLDDDNRRLQRANADVEEQLMQSAKLSALGQMVAGITHEINTPLAYVKAVFELIKERFSQIPGILDEANEDEETRQEQYKELQLLLEDGLHGLEEMATLVRTMRNFSRLDKGNVTSFAVEDTIERALIITQPQLKMAVDVKREFDSVPPISGSESQLRQVLVNLIVNAADAMSSLNRRGLLTVRTRITSSDTVQIDICDNGLGIPKEALGRVFDPFFTTKSVGKGTGMGLSICYRIIENHGGTITLNSKPGAGTIVTLTLPRQDEKFSNADAEAMLSSKVAQRGVRCTLLSPHI